MAEKANRKCLDVFSNIVIGLKPFDWFESRFMASYFATMQNGMQIGFWRRYSSEPHWKLRGAVERMENFPGSKFKKNAFSADRQLLARIENRRKEDKEINHDR